MTALIIFLAAWRHRRASMCRQPPPALDVALEHIIWLRLDDPGMTPQQAGAMIGAVVTTWAEAVLAFAAAWEALPAENP